MRALLIVFAAIVGACTQCTPPTCGFYPGTSSPAPCPNPVLEGGAIHEYVCPIGDSGESWTCADGLTTPVGTCLAKGCVPTP